MLLGHLNPHAGFVFHQALHRFRLCMCSPTDGSVRIVEDLITRYFGRACSLICWMRIHNLARLI